MNRPHRLNVAGPFYVVDGCCTACGVPDVEAPDLFAWDESDQCFVRKQPSNPEELRQMISVIAHAELRCIRYRGRDTDVISALENVGEIEQCDDAGSRQALPPARIQADALKPHARDAPDIVAQPPAIVIGMLLFGLAIHYFVWTVAILPMTLSRILGATLFLAGGFIAHVSQRALMRAGTNVLPTRPTLAVVTDGPYRYTRNPLYLAAICIYVGISLWVNALAPLLLTLPMAWLLHRGVVLPEERYLDRKFGATYQTYSSGVRRWL